MPSVSLSTMWGIGRLPSFREFAEKAQAFGCPFIELNHGFPAAWLAELEMGALDGLNVAVSSVHDPCPNALMESGRYPWSYQLAAIDEGERRTAVSIARGSIDLAARWHARAVVLHLGRIGRSYTAEEARLRQLWTDKGPEAEDFVALREHLIGERRAQAAAALEQAQKTLHELAPYAADHGIRLGLENRQDYTELPGIDEMGVLLSGVDPAVVGFWLDVGHAMLMDRLGFVPYEEWLTRYGSRLVGIHLHDVVGVVDHRAPGVTGGVIPWDLTVRGVPADAVRVMEINQHTDEALVREAVPFLRSMGLIT